MLIGNASAGPVTVVQTSESADVLVEAPLSPDAWLMSHEVVERETPVVDEVPEVTLKTPVAIAPLPPAVLTGAGMLIGTALVKMIRKIRLS
jgi:hypothetical protein